MAQFKALVTDYIGTLTNARRYTMETSLLKLYNVLNSGGFACQKQAFLEAYSRAHEKYRLIRYGELREITNAVWVSETLQSLGFDTTAWDPRMNAALDVFFGDYIDSLELRSGAQKLLMKAKETCKLGLVSNFTYAPVVHTSIKRLGVGGYFDAVIVSGDIGWRKPHRNIFDEVLRRLGVRAEEAVFMGDCPSEDIKGAAEAGMRTVFVQSQFFGLADLKTSGQKADFALSDLEEVSRNFAQIALC